MPSLNKQFPRLLPEPIRKNIRVADLIDTTFKAYNAARLAEACRLFTEKMLAQHSQARSLPTPLSGNASTLISERRPPSFCNAR